MKRTILSGLLTVVGLASAIALRKLPTDHETPDAQLLDTLRESGAI